LQQESFGIRAGHHASLDQFAHRISRPIQSGVAGALDRMNDNRKNSSNAALVMARTRDELQDAEIKVARKMVRSGPGH
jgi:hypothetical protein